MVATTGCMTIVTASTHLRLASKPTESSKASPPAVHPAPASVRPPALGLERFTDQFVGGGLKELREIVGMTRDLFARPPAADLGLGAGRSPLDQLGKPSGDSRGDGLLDTSGQKQPSQRSPLAPSTDRSALHGGLARSGNGKDVAPVPGQSTSETSPDGNTSHTRTIHRDGSVVTTARQVEEDGTVSASHSRQRPDGSSVTTTTVVDPSGRWYRTREQTDANGYTNSTLQGDQSLFYSRLTRPNIDGNPDPDRTDASLLPPWVKPKVTPPKSPDRTRPAQDDGGPQGSRLAIDPKDLVSDPTTRQTARDVARERLGEFDRQVEVLPPRPM